MNLTDDMLREATAEVRDAILDSLSVSDNHQHIFSQRFERKMNKLIRKQRAQHHVLQKVAIVFFALLMGCSVWLITDANASSVFLKWVQDVYENSIVYKFFGNTHKTGISNYCPTWLPEGYVESDTIVEDFQILIEYRSINDEIIYFHCMELGEHAQTETVLEGMMVPTQVIVNGMQGRFYQATDVTQSNELIWFDTEHDIVFNLSGHLDKSVMLHIAESVSLDTMTK